MVFNILLSKGQITCTIWNSSPWMSASREVEQPPMKSCPPSLSQSHTSSCSGRAQAPSHSLAQSSVTAAQSGEAVSWSRQ